MVTQEEKDKCKELDLEPEVVFNTLSDLKTFAVKDEGTKESILEISGYGLSIKLNRDLIGDINDIENLLDGIKDLFRQLIMNDLLKDSQEENPNP